MPAPYSPLLDGVVDNHSGNRSDLLNIEVIDDSANVTLVIIVVLLLDDHFVLQE